MKQRNGIEADISRFDDIIEESFRMLIQNGKGIEINTSGFRQGFGSAFPDLKYVKMYRELGGEILTIGSDSHTVEDIGANVADGAEIASAAGFRHLTYFKERKPYFVKID
jgi:histidinol-phosphatase (PHP family)